MPVALAQSGYCPEGCESRRGQAEEGKKWATIPSAAFALFPIDGSLSSGHSSLVQAQELVPGFRTPCFLGFSGIHFQQLLFSALVCPQIRLFGSHCINMAWVPSHHHCHCLLYKMVGKDC